MPDKPRNDIPKSAPQPSSLPKGRPSSTGDRAPLNERMETPKPWPAPPPPPKGDNTGK